MKKRCIIIILILSFTLCFASCNKESKKYKLYEKTNILWHFEVDENSSTHITINEIRKIDKNNFEILFTPKVELTITHVRTYPKNKYGYGVLGCKKFYSENNINIDKNNCTLPNKFYLANERSILTLYYSNSDLEEYGNDFDQIITDNYSCSSYYYIPNAVAY